MTSFIGVFLNSPYYKSFLQDSSECTIADPRNQFVKSPVTQTKNCLRVNSFNK